MGLDGVALVMAFEEEFGVAIENEAASKMITPRDVIEYIVESRGIGTRKLCVTRKAFHQVRERLMKIGIERSAIKLGAPLSQFFPENTRRSLWIRARGSISSWRWPDLVRPAKLQKALPFFSLLLGVAVLVSILIITSGRKILDAILLAILLAIVSAGCAASLLFQATRGQCRQFPNLATIRDLSIRVAAGEGGNQSWKEEEFARDAIASKVRQIVIEQLGLTDSDYTEDKEFVRDFGMD